MAEGWSAYGTPFPTMQYWARHRAACVRGPPTCHKHKQFAHIFSPGRWASTARMIVSTDVTTGITESTTSSITQTDRQLGLPRRSRTIQQSCYATESGASTYISTQQNRVQCHPMSSNPEPTQTRGQTTVEQHAEVRRLLTTQRQHNDNTTQRQHNDNTTITQHNDNTTTTQQHNANTTLTQRSAFHRQDARRRRDR